MADLEFVIFLFHVPDTDNPKFPSPMQVISHRGNHEPCLEDLFAENLKRND